MIIPVENIVSILLGFLGLIVTSVLLLSYKSNKHVNIYLIIILISTSMKSFYGGFISDQTAIIWLKPFSMIIVPSFYLYFRSLINDEQISVGKSIPHFLYPTLFSILFLVQTFYLIIPEEIWISIRELNILNYIFFYLIITTHLLHDFYLKRNQDLSKERHFNSLKNWILPSFILFVLISVTRVINVCFFAENNVGAFSSVSVIMRIVLIFTVLLKMITTPEIIFGFPKLLERLAQTSKEAQLTNVEIWNLAHPYVTNVQDLKLTPIINTKLEAYAAEIEQFVHTHHSFRDSKYTLKHLATDINIPSSHLTYVIKYHCKLSYIEFKNHYRILDSLHLIENDYLRSHTLDSLALKVGFVSYNSFYVSFKKQIGLSPKEYTNSNDNLIHSHPLFSS